MADNTYTLPCHTDDGIDHGFGRIEDCLEAVIDRYQDGDVFCPILWSGGKCEDCMTAFEERQG